MKKSLLLLFCSFICLSPLLAQQLSPNDISAKYNAFSPVKVKSKIYETDSAYHWWINFKIADPRMTPDDFDFSYIPMKDSLDIEDYLEMRMIEFDSVLSFRNDLWAKIIIEKPTDYRVLRLMVDEHTGNSRDIREVSLDDSLAVEKIISLDKPINVFNLFQPIVSSADIQFFATEKKPLMNEYVASGEEIIVKSSLDTLYYYYYPDDFTPADPPMALRQTQVSKELSALPAKMHLANTSFVPVEKGMYFFQTDTLATEGVSIRVGDAAYPGLTDWSDMIGPLIYMSTRPEYNKLSNAPNAKQALDEYWLTVAKSQELAKQIINDFFGNVLLANQYFTHFKEGWKTDMGMVYIIMGPPDEVFYEADKEIWNYLESGSNPKISFTFVRINNIFTPNYFVLERKKEYEQFW